MESNSISLEHTKKTLVFRVLLGAAILVIVLLLHYSGSLKLPIVELSAVSIFTILVNIPYHFLLKRTHHVYPLVTFISAIDVVTITFLIHFSTGGENSICILGYPMLIVNAGLSLPETSAYVLAIFSTIIYGSLLFFERTHLPNIYGHVYPLSIGYVVARMLATFCLLLTSAFFSANSSKTLKKKNIELQIAHRDLEMSMNQLIQSEKSAAVGRLAAALAHEINKPNFMIKNLAEILSEETSEQDSSRDSLQVILRQSKNIEESVRRLLSFAKPRAIEAKLIDLNSHISRSVNSMKTIAGPGITFELNLNPSLPEIYADEGQLEQVLSNLIVNAIQSMKKEGTIAITTEAISQRGNPKERAGDTPKEERVQVMLSDTGEGISPENITRIFEPYFSTKEINEGVGLGLAICYEIVTAHAGHIFVESTQGKGTTFRVVLPVHYDKHRQARAPENM